jgi:hypothetical protein
MSVLYLQLTPQNLENLKKLYDADASCHKMTYILEHECEGHVLQQLAA